jgi:CDP-glucose 4,6-dehydratase
MMAVGQLKPWARRRVLVTGATGFLGSWLAAWLVDRGADTVALVRDDVPRSNFFRLGLDRSVVSVHGQLEDYDVLERTLNEHEIEVVFHLAAQTLVGIANRNPLSTFDANIRGTWNLLEAARRHPAIRAIVVASSDKAYGTQATLPYREDAPLVGRHPYDVSKSCVDLIAQSYWHSYRLPVSITRCGNFYGGGDLNFNRIVPGTIRSLFDGQRPIVRSDGTLRRDYVFVKEAVDAYTLLAEHMLEGRALGECYNFSNNQPLRVLEVVDEISRLMNRSDVPPVVLNEASNEIPDQFLDATKASVELGWRPKYTFESGLVETIAWYEAFLRDAPKSAWAGVAEGEPR